MNVAEFPELEAALAGQYRFDREIGRGGMGVVYLASDLRLDRPVAIKVLPASLGANPDMKERFLREARTAAKLSHPNIVPVFRADEAHGCAYFVMAYVDGESLADRVRDRGPLPAGEAVRYLREVAWALAYAHARGVVHRDVKPENIMVERGSGRALVTDFGIARADFNPRLTADGHVLGTAYYMSPEQITGEPVDGRSDLYSLGVVGYFVLSGRLPFEDPTPSAILVAHATRAAPALNSVAPEVPHQLAAVIDRCLAKTPEARFESGEALAEALEKAMSDAERSTAARGVSGTAVVSEAQAAALWKRAAQLQAEAAQRLEQRARDPRALGARGGDAPTPGAGYRLRDVEAAAIEAGISHHYVALALAELPVAAEAGSQTELSGWSERAATRFLGSAQRSLSVSRVIAASPRRTLQAVGRALQAPPFSLALRDTIGGHPLDGGILVFDVPPWVEMRYEWTYTRYNCYAKQVRVSLRPLPAAPGACEVTMFADLRTGVRVNWFAGTTIAGAFSAGSAALSIPVFVKGLAITGAVVAAPALGVGALVGVGTVFGYGALYRWGLRKTQEEFERALAAVANDVRSEQLFGTPVTPAPALRSTPPVDDSMVVTG